MRLSAGLLALVVTLGLLASAACGGDDDEGGPEGSGPLADYYRDLEAAITDAGERFAAIEPIEADEDSSDEDLNEAAERFFDELVEVFEGFQQDLREIEPPEEVAELHNEGTEATEQFLDQARDYRQRAAEAESVEEVFGIVIEFSAAGFDVLTGFQDSCVDLQRVADENNVDVDLRCTTGTAE